MSSQAVLTSKDVRQISEYVWELPMTAYPGMRVPGRIFASAELMEKALADRGVEQVANVANLPGIVGASLAMPDIHWGYGFPIGGVAAMDVESGVVSPGGVGFDINCGVRLLRTSLDLPSARPHLARVMDALERGIPKGVGTKGRVTLTDTELGAVMREGSQWAVANGLGWPEDIVHTEEGGRLAGADPGRVSERVFERGRPQSGTLGAGNHFLEVQVVDEIFDHDIATVFGLVEGHLTVMIHSGSRGVGHQICTDHLRALDRVSRAYGYQLPDRQLACAPIDSNEGRHYLAAMACAVNYAFANRQLLAHWTREAFARVFDADARTELGMSLLWDVAHNIAKFEEHEVDGRMRRLLVHRKGATRAFGPGHRLVPEEYRAAGQPVIVPGDMGSASYVLAGTAGAMQQSFGSACHGAGRAMSRSQAKKQVKGEELRAELRGRGIDVRAGSIRLLSEEAPLAYKDVDAVVAVCEGAGIARKVARLRPLGVVKG